LNQLWRKLWCCTPVEYAFKASLPGKLSNHYLAVKSYEIAKTPSRRFLLVNLLANNSHLDYNQFMNKSCKQHFSAIQMALRGKRLKATPGRVAVLDVFTHNQKPLSIKELKKFIGADGPDIATLYRNTESLTAEGMLVRVNLGAKNAAYELASRGHHHHLICSSCGLINDITIVSRPGLNAQALAQTKDFSSVSGHSLEFFGICKKCKVKLRIKD
jgi:Fe2+ or Zn2+ uptake regulation protein